MAYIPLQGRKDLIKSLLSEDEIKALTPQGLFIDSEFFTLWTKTVQGEMIPLGGGAAIDISQYPGLGEVLTTNLPLQAHTINGQPTNTVEVLNHLYARATSLEASVRNPRILLSDVVVDKEAETINFNVAYVDFLTLYRSEAILTVADGLPADPLQVGDLITLPEQIVNPRVRNFTVPITEFSTVRNRLMITAYTDKDEYLESNRITLDLEALPIPPGELTINSIEIVGDKLHVNVDQAFIAYQHTRNLFLLGTDGSTQRPDYNDESTKVDGTVDLEFDFNYDGIGDIKAYLTATDLNVDPVRSNTYVFRAITPDVHLTSNIFNPETLELTLKFEGADMADAPIGAVMGTAQFAFNGLDTVEKTLENGVLTATLAQKPAHNKYINTTATIPLKDGGNVILHVITVLPDAEPMLPVIDFANRTINQYDSGELVSHYLEIADSEEGPFTPLDAIYATPSFSHPQALEIDAVYAPINGEYWVRAAVAYYDRTVYGLPVQSNLDLTNMEWSSGYPRINSENKVSLSINNNIYMQDFADATPMKVLAKPKGSDVPDTVILETTYGDWESYFTMDMETFRSVGDELEVRVVLDTGNGKTYTLDYAPLYLDASTYPAAELTLETAVYDDETGDLIFTGSTTTADRPLVADAQYRYGSDVIEEAFIVSFEWTGNQFVARGTALKVDQVRNCDVRLVSRSIDAGTISSLTWQTNWFNNVVVRTGDMRIRAVKYDLLSGVIGFDIESSDVDRDHTRVVTAIDSHGTRATVPLVRDFELVDLTLSRYLVPEWLTGDITYTAVDTYLNGDVVSASITVPAYLPHSMHDNRITFSSLDIDQLRLVIEADAVAPDELGTEAVWTVHPVDGSRGLLVTDFDTLNESLLGMAEGELVVTRRHRVGAEIVTNTATINYAGPAEILELVDSTIDGDVIVRPTLYDGGFDPKLIGAWSVQDSLVGGYIDIGHPSSYSDTEGERGVVIPNFYFNENTTGVLRRSYNGYFLYMKMPEIHADNAPRIIEVLQSGRNLQVQWRIRPDAINSFTANAVLVARVTDQLGTTIDYPISADNLSAVNLSPVVLDDTTRGMVSIAIIAQTPDGQGGIKESVPSRFDYMLTDNPYVRIVEIERSASNSCTVFLESKNIVLLGQFAPKVTALIYDASGAQTVLFEQVVDLVGDTGQIEIPYEGQENKLFDVAISYESALDGEKLTMRQQFTLSEDVVFEDIAVDGSDLDLVTASGRVYSSRPTGVYVLQSRRSNRDDWSQDEYHTTTNASITKDGLIDLSFTAIDSSGLHPLTTYRIGTHGESGLEYTSPMALSDETYFRVTELEITPAGNGVQRQDEFHFEGRGVNPKSQLQFLEADGRIRLYDYTGTGSDTEVEGIKSYYASFAEDPLNLPVTIRTVDDNGDFFITTYPEGSEQGEFPTDLTINGVKYVTAEDGESVAVYAEIELTTIQPDSVLLSIEHGANENIGADLVSLGDDKYSFLKTVDDNNLTTFVVIALDGGGIPWEKRYTFTGDEITEGDWGVIIIPPSQELVPTAVLRKIDTIRNSRYADIIIPLDSDLVPARPTATITYADTGEEVDFGAQLQNRYNGTYDFTIPLDINGGREFSLYIQAEDELNSFIVNYTVSESDPLEEEEFELAISRVAFHTDIDGTFKHLYFAVEESGFKAYNALYYFDDDYSTLEAVGTNWGTTDNSERWVRMDVTGKDLISNFTIGGESNQAGNGVGRYVFTGSEPTIMSPPYDSLNSAITIEDPEFVYNYERNTYVLKLAGDGHLIGTQYQRVIIDGTERPVSYSWVHSNEGSYRLEVDIPSTDIRLIHVELQKRSDSSSMSNEFFVVGGFPEEEAPVQLPQPTVKFITNPDTMEVIYHVELTDVENTSLNIVLNNDAFATPIAELTPLGGKAYSFKLPFASRSGLTQFVVYNDTGAVKEAVSYSITGTEEEIIPETVSLNVNKVEFVTFNSGLVEMYVNFSASNLLADSTQINMSDVGAYVAPTTPLRLFEGAYEIGHEVTDTDVTGFTVTLLDEDFIPYLIDYTMTGSELITDGDGPVVPVEHKAGEFGIRNVSYSTDSNGDVVTVDMDIDPTGASQLKAFAASEGSMSAPDGSTDVTDLGDGWFRLVTPVGTANADVLIIAYTDANGNYREGYYFTNGVPENDSPLGAMEITSLGDVNVLGLRGLYDTDSRIVIEVNSPQVDWSQSKYSYPSGSAGPATEYSFLSANTRMDGVTELVLDGNNYVEGNTVELYGFVNAEIMITDTITIVGPVDYSVNLDAPVYQQLWSMSDGSWDVYVGLDVDNAAAVIEDSVAVVIDDGEPTAAAYGVYDYDGSVEVGTAIPNLDFDTITVMYVTQADGETHTKTFSYEDVATTFHSDDGSPIDRPVMRLRNVMFQTQDGSDIVIIEAHGVDLSPSDFAYVDGSMEFSIAHLGDAFAIDSNIWGLTFPVSSLDIERFTVTGKTLGEEVVEVKYLTASAGDGITPPGETENDFEISDVMLEPMIEAVGVNATLTLEGFTESSKVYVAVNGGDSFREATLGAGDGPNEYLMTYVAEGIAEVTEFAVLYIPVEGTYLNAVWKQVQYSLGAFSIKDAVYEMEGSVGTLSFTVDPYYPDSEFKTIQFPGTEFGTAINGVPEQVGAEAYRFTISINEAQAAAPQFTIMYAPEVGDPISAIYFKDGAPELAYEIGEINVGSDPSFPIMNAAFDYTDRPVIMININPNGMDLDGIRYRLANSETFIPPMDLFTNYETYAYFVMDATDHVAGENFYLDVPIGDGNTIEVTLVVEAPVEPGWAGDESVDSVEIMANEEFGYTLRGALFTSAVADGIIEYKTATMEDFGPVDVVNNVQEGVWLIETFVPENDYEYVEFRWNTPDFIQQSGRWTFGTPDGGGNDDTPTGDELNYVEIRQVDGGNELALSLPHTSSDQISPSSIYYVIGDGDWTLYDGDLIDTRDGVEAVIPLSTIEFDSFEFEYTTSYSESYYSYYHQMNTTEVYLDSDGNPYTPVRPMAVPDGIMTTSTSIADGNNLQIVSYETYDENNFVMNLSHYDYYGDIELSTISVLVNGDQTPLEYALPPTRDGRYVTMSVLINDYARTVHMQGFDARQRRYLKATRVVSYPDNDLPVYLIGAEHNLIEEGTTLVEHEVYLYNVDDPIDQSTVNVVLSNPDLVISSLSSQDLSGHYRVDFRTNGMEFTSVLVTYTTVAGNPGAVSYLVGENGWYLVEENLIIDGEFIIADLDATEEANASLNATVVPIDDTVNNLTIAVNGSTDYVTPDSLIEADDGVVSISHITDEAYIVSLSVKYTNADALERVSTYTLSNAYGVPASDDNLTLRAMVRYYNDDEREYYIKGIVEGDDLKIETIDVLIDRELESTWGTTVVEVKPGMYTFNRRVPDNRTTNDVMIVLAENNSGTPFRLQSDFTDKVTPLPVAMDFDSVTVAGSSHFTSVEFELPDTGKSYIYSSQFYVGNDQDRLAIDDYHMDESFERLIVARIDEATDVAEIYTHVASESTVRTDVQGNPLSDVQDRRFGYSNGTFVITKYDEVMVDGVLNIQVDALVNDSSFSYAKALMFVDDWGNLNYDNGDVEQYSTGAEYVKLAEGQYRITFPKPPNTLESFSIATSTWNNEYTSLAEYFINPEAPELPKILSVEVWDSGDGHQMYITLNNSAAEAQTQPVISYGGDYEALSADVTEVDGHMVGVTNAFPVVDFDRFTIRYLNDFNEVVEISHEMNSTETYHDESGVQTSANDVTGDITHVEAWDDGTGGHVAHIVIDEASVSNIKDVSEIRYRLNGDEDWTLFDQGAVDTERGVEALTDLTFTEDDTIQIRYERANGDRVYAEEWLGSGTIKYRDENGFDPINNTLGALRVTELNPGETWHAVLRHETSEILDGLVTYSIDDESMVGTFDSVADDDAGNGIAELTWGAEVDREGYVDMVVSYKLQSGRPVYLSFMFGDEIIVDPTAEPSDGPAVISAEVTKYDDTNWDFIIIVDDRPQADLEDDDWSYRVNGGEWQEYEVYASASGDNTSLEFEVYSDYTGVPMPDVTTVEVRYTNGGVEKIAMLTMGTVETYENA